MKAISLMQPWAWLMVNGYKDIENRKWKTSLRGPVLVHASKTWDREVFPIIKGEANSFEFPDFYYRRQIAQAMPVLISSYKTGGIVGQFTITDVVTESKSRWFFGPYGFVVKDARPLPFVPLRGQLNFFEVSDEIIKQLGL